MYMTYDDFIKLYPAVDLFMEIFKGIGPTSVAILAIVLNHQNSIKRDKENRKNSLYYTIQREMLDKFIELSQLQWNCGANLINVLSVPEKDKREELFDKYTQSLYNMLYKAQEINDYAQTLFKNFKITPDCNNIVFHSRRFADELNSITEKYIQIWEIEHCEKIINQKLDVMRGEVLAITENVKEYTDNCMGKISENLHSLLI